MDKDTYYDACKRFRCAMLALWYAIIEALRFEAMLYQFNKAFQKRYKK